MTNQINKNNQLQEVGYKMQQIDNNGTFNTIKDDILKGGTTLDIEIDYLTNVLISWIEEVKHLQEEQQTVKHFENLIEELNNI